MDVSRTGNGQPVKSSGLSTERTRASRSTETTVGGSTTGAVPSERGDRVTISEEALRLLDAAAVDEPETIPTSSLSPERRAVLLERIAGGWYDRPEVKSAVVNELAGHLAKDDSPNDVR